MSIDHGKMCWSIAKNGGAACFGDFDDTLAIRNKYTTQNFPEVSNSSTEQQGQPKHRKLNFELNEKIDLDRLS